MKITELGFYIYALGAIVFISKAIYQMKDQDFKNNVFELRETMNYFISPPRLRDAICYGSIIILLLIVSTLWPLKLLSGLWKTKA